MKIDALANPAFTMDVSNKIPGETDRYNSMKYIQGLRFKHEVPVEHTFPSTMTPRLMWPLKTLRVRDILGDICRHASFHFEHPMENDP
jgi:hypothetical protein